MAHADRAHAVLAPSFMHIALNCPLSVVLKEKLPPVPPTPQSLFGTRCHEAGAMLLEDFLLHKERGTDPEARFKHEDYEPEVRKIAYGWRDAVWKNVLQESITGKAWEVESKVTYSKKFDIWGSADFWLIATDERANRMAHIPDLKTGRVEVPIKESLQLPTYALALRQEIRELGKDLDYVVCSIHQPFSLEGTWKTVKYTNKQLDRHEAKILKLVDAVYGGKTPKAKVGSHCKYCPAQSICTAYGKKLEKETALAFVEPEKDIKFPEIQTIPLEARVKIALNEKALTTFISSCKKSVMQELYNGTPVSGAKLVEGRGRRQIDEGKLDLVEKTCQKFGIKPYEEKLKGITALTSDFAQKTDSGTAKKIIDGFCTESKKAIVLGDRLDPRPEVKPSSLVLDLFDDNE